MKDSQGNKYDAWGIAERARGFVLLTTFQYTRSEAISEFVKDAGHPWSELEKDYKAVKVKFDIVESWNKERQRYE